MSKLVQVDSIIIPAWQQYLPAGFNTVPAQAMAYAIARQESRFDGTMFQKGGGPARGPWQFEGGPMSGTAEVLTHKASRLYALQACERMGIEATRTAVYGALGSNVALGAVFARLLLYTDAHSLPAVVSASEEEAWQYYIRNWHPGAPHRQTWGAFWREAVQGLAA